MDVVTMNSAVTLRNVRTGDVESYTLVYPNQADIANQKLSVLSPIGASILGCRKGDAFHWRIPAGWRRFTVEQVAHVPDREAAYHS